MCHRVRGTLAGGGVAPDLTHLASRKTLAAGTLPLTRGTLAAWITDPQSIKPGSNMPQIKLPTADFQALVSYLEGLE
jgi:cytochrome c oxidase subunit 2